MCSTTRADGGPPPPPVAPPPPPVAPPPPPSLFQTAAMVDRLEGGPVPPVPAAGKLFGAPLLQRIASVPLKSSRPPFTSLRYITQQQQQQQQKVEAIEPFHLGVLIQYSIYVFCVELCNICIAM